MGRREFFIDPVTRIEGHLGVRVAVDTSSRKAIPETVRCFSTMYAGFEVFLIGRPPEDVIHLSSRICGVCGASHANADLIAVEMAYGVTPTPLGVALRNMAYAMTDHIYDHSIILTMLEGPDYSSPIVAFNTKSVYEEAKKTLAEHRDIHGFTRIVDIMDALTPLTGKLWKLAVKFQRYAREAGVLIYGRHSHPSTLIPGGLMTDLTNIEYLMTSYMFRLTKLTAWAKYLYLVFEDLLKFYENIGYADNGVSYHSSPKVSTVGAVASSGLYEDPEAYASICGEAWDIDCHVEWEEFYKYMDRVARRRFIKPGIVIRGKLVSDSYAEYQVSIVEHVQKAFYDDWIDKVEKLPWLEVLREHGYSDPLGNKLNWGYWDKLAQDILGRSIDVPIFHPWIKVTIPRFERIDWNKKYTWVTTVRLIWKTGEVLPFEVGPYARILVASYQTSEDYLGLYKTGNGVVKVTLPRACSDELPNTVCEEMTFEWKIPPYSSTIYRLWARAFDLLIDVAAAWNYTIKAEEYITTKKVFTSRPWKRWIPSAKTTFGVGFTEAPRGTVRHWIVQRGGKTLNIQIHAPTTSNASPYDKYGRSPFEESIANTYVTEEREPQEWVGLDFVRTIRSFDPCLACATHITILDNGRKTVKIIKQLIAP